MIRAWVASFPVSTAIFFPHQKKKASSGDCQFFSNIQTGIIRNEAKPGTRLLFVAQSKKKKERRRCLHLCSQPHEQDEILHQGCVELALLDQLEYFRVALPGGGEEGGRGLMEEDPTVRLRP